MTAKGAIDATAWRTASLSFGLLLLIVIDITLLGNTSLSMGLVIFLNSSLSYLGNVVGTVVVLLLLASWLYRFIADDVDRDWVVSPKLHAELERERREEREAEILRVRT
ncbi:hypothetical protein [Paraburkholderia adhaesiva]|uniref:hypothetical protein n=1 Tax=Paraburkholderia adhaesiva TaxID=2883244 RepID=UPI001F3AD7D1|nr:hypothetical protein [Paraburkholderia adhaesiva]